LLLQGETRQHRGTQRGARAAARAADGETDRAVLTLPPVEAKMLAGQVGYINIDALSRPW